MVVTHGKIAMPSASRHFPLAKLGTTERFNARQNYIVRQLLGYGSFMVRVMFIRTLIDL